jgi:uncharacterized protein HemY
LESVGVWLRNHLAAASGPECTEVARLLTSLGDLQQRRQKFAKADSAFRAALDMYDALDLQDQ